MVKKEKIKKEIIEYKDAVYVGETKNGKFHGKGEFTVTKIKELDEKDELNTVLEMEEYKGEFKNGLLDGKGIITYVNGCTFEGRFKKGLKHGKGILKDPLGNVFIDTTMNIPLEGEWYEDEFIG
tara:strand:+ start:99 stop:470 length:372 start_codon:yes stop_codon:yes gene_type:complete